MKKEIGFLTALVLLALCAAAWAEGTWEEAWAEERKDNRSRTGGEV